jgi:hypothetical protein
LIFRQGRSLSCGRPKSKRGTIDYVARKQNSAHSRACGNPEQQIMRRIFFRLDPRFRGDERS